MNFSKITLEKIDELRPYFLKNECRICDFTLGGTLMWRDLHGTEYAIKDGILYFRTNHPIVAFAPPMGPNIGEKEYREILDFCAAEGIAPQMVSVSEKIKEDILKMFPDSEARTDEAWSDYLYLSEDIKELSGKKFSGQRNQINKFLRDNIFWKFEAITPENIPQVKEFFERHALEHVKDSETYTEGNKKAVEVLENMDIYNVSGGVLSAGSTIVGASLGEVVGDTLYIHIEKADISFRGAYQMLSNQFALMYATDEVKYINREEDDGDEGLRKSKQSYHPVELLVKYVMKIT